MEEFQALLPEGTDGKGSGRWLFGLEKPSALDAHLVTFIKRMRDVGRKEIVPEALGNYADAAMAGEEWRGIRGL